MIMIRSQEGDFADERREMVERQLIPRGIRDKAVLNAFLRVPREFFVPDDMRTRAYDDCPLPTARGQTISQPYIVAYMTELLELPANRRKSVLEIGAGAGYQSAILAAMGHKVWSVERIGELAEFARENLRKLDYCSEVEVLEGDGCLGWAEHAPYDGILVTAAAPVIPPELARQLAVGGRIVIPCGDTFMQVMIRGTKNDDGSLDIEQGIGCRFVPLIGRNGFSPE